MAIWCGFAALFGIIGRVVVVVFIPACTHTLFKAEHRVRWWWSVCTFVISFCMYNNSQRNWNSFIHSFMCLARITWKKNLNLKENINIKKMKQRKEGYSCSSSHSKYTLHSTEALGISFIYIFPFNHPVLVDWISKCWIIEIKINGFL